MNTNMGLLRFIILSLTCILASFTSYAQANRTEEAVEKKLEDYRTKLAETTEAIHKKQEELKENVVSGLEKNLAEQAANGRLDIAEHYYKVKKGVEKKSLKERDYENLPDENKSILTKYLEETMEVEQGIHQKVEEENDALYMYCLNLLAKAKSLSSDKGLKKEELDWLTSFLMQFPLPKGAEFPQNGEKVGFLHCSLYAGAFEKSEDIAPKGKLRRVFPSGSISIPWGVQDELFGLIWEGLFYAEKSGEYRFSLRSDDFAQLVVDGKIVVSYQSQGSTEGNGALYLEKGWRTFKLNYVQITGPKHIRLKVKTPDSLEESDISAMNFASKPKISEGSKSGTNENLLLL